MTTRLALILAMLGGSTCGFGHEQWTTESDSTSETQEEADSTDLAQQRVVRFDLSDRHDANLAEALAKVRQSSQPTVVDLTWSNVGGNHLKQLSGLPELRELYLFGTDVTDRDLRHLGELPNLETIDLGGGKLTPDGILQFRSSRKLKRLFLAGMRPPVSDGMLEQIARAWPGLESLSVDGGRITDEGLAHIGKLSRLHYLNLSGTQVTDRGLERLTGLAHLNTLHLDDTEITDQGMVHLGKVTSLEKLSLNHTGITHRGLKEVQSLKNLKRIYFVGTKVNDAGLEYLKSLKQIEFVVPSYNNSPEAIEELKQSLPLFKKNKTG